MKEVVRERYAKHAVELPSGDIPPSLGLGDVVAIARLRRGDTVLDLGSGPGHDLLAAARAVGSTGRAIGVDFTPEMIDRARRDAASFDNVSILEGELERLPLPCASIDVVISNCVINLVDDKRRALIEAFRVLRPGGRLAVLDTAFEEDPGEAVRSDAESWSCCAGGALLVSEYESILCGIGFEDVSLRWQDATCGEGGAIARAVAVTAAKPASAIPVSRPAVPREREAIEALIGPARIEDTIVEIADGRVVGAASIERYGNVAVIRAFKGTARLLGAGLDVARWSGALDVYAADAPDRELFESFRFESLSGGRSRLRFEDADLPLLGKPSKKQLPTFQDGACC